MYLAIVDDQREDRAELVVLLERYCAQRGLSAEYTSFSSAEELLAVFRPGMFHLLFLDIYMGGMDGMEAARSICKIDPACRLIFYTSSYTCAVASYEVRAAYYLTKPTSYGRLSAAMDVACGSLLEESRCLTVHQNGIALELLLSDLLYMDCVAAHTYLHLKDRRLLVDERASDMLVRLGQEKQFLVCNRNVAVNMDWIERVEEGNFVLKSGQCVPIRQRGRAGVKREFLAYSLRTLRKESGRWRGE